jgi:hypothetical protein
MRSDDELTVFASVLMVFIVLAATWGGYSFASYACTAKWEGSGMKTNYGVLSGCRVQLKDGRWMPATNVREAPP